MNKKVIGFLLAIPALMGFGLTSCSDEESIAVKETAQDKLVEVTVKASLSDLTRASLTPDKNIIKFEWDMNDVVTVVNADNGKYLGTLKVSKIQESDHRVCEFKGSAAIPAGKVKLNFFYLGTAGVASFGDGLTVNDYSVDFSNQDGTAKFAENDILISTGEFVNVQDGNLGMINFGRDFAYGRFILKYNGEEIDLNGKTVTICANTGRLYNKATLNFQSASYTYEEGAIAVSPESNDFYVSFPATEKVNLKFVVNEFDGTKGESLVADTYYTANTNGDPIVVEMRHSDGTDDQQTFKLTYAANYDGAPEAEKSFTWKAVSPYAYVVKNYDLFTREGYVITSWNTQADGNGVAYEAGSNYIVTYPDHVNGTLYAQWEKNTVDYKVTLKYEDGKTEEISKPSTEDTQNVTLPAAPDKDGYDFAGWKEEGTESPVAKGEWELTKDKPQVTLVPVYTEKKYEWKIQWKDDPAVGNEVYKTKLEGGTSPHTLASVHPANPTKEGYKFLGWEYEGKMIKSEKEVVMIADNLNPIIYAKWEKATYDLIVNCWSNDGTDNKSVQTENHSLPHTMYADDWDVPTRTGYKFVGWGVTADATTPIESVTFNTPDAKNVYAIWKKDASNGSIVAPGAGGSDY
ncbi:MAG: InlB B-repeat-containing protein [Muribaculaceae bacterium]|nr:InlB B-repeat-containing protein [Muribaculaceae bacterium]